MRLCATLLFTSLLVQPSLGDQPEFEVLVIGTYHAPVMFWQDSYTPAHIRAALIAAKPDVVAVESHPEWFAKGRYHVVTYEAEGVAVPWARDRGIPAFGVDWKDIEAWERKEEAMAVRAAAPLQRAHSATRTLDPRFFGELPAAAVPKMLKLRQSSQPEADWEHLNGVHDDAWAESRFGKTPAKRVRLGRRDRGIAENCLAVMRKYPGKRLAVVVGAAHKPYLDVHFGRMEGVRVLRLGHDVPLPSANAIRAAWTSDDLVNSLAHMIDAGHAYFHVEMVDVPRARRLLKMLERRGDRRTWARYFAARLLVLTGKLRKAEKAFDALLKGGELPDVRYPFALRVWRMRYTLGEAVRLEKARLLLKRSARGDAESLLKPVMKSLRARLNQLKIDHPPVPRRVQTIRDAGFELGGQASDFFAGWATYLPLGHGMLAWGGDESIKVEGKRSLVVEVTEASARGFPFYIRQEVSVPLSKHRIERVKFGLSLRGEGVEQVTVFARRFYASKNYEPLVSQELNLERGRWTRAEISFALPSVRAFSIVIKFKAPKGAKLWLDNGTPLPVEYTTIPKEWSRVATALAFCESLLGKKRTPEPPQKGALAGLKDAGFESGRLATMAGDGWFSEHARKGLLRVEADESVRTEGKRSLRVEVLKTNGGSPMFLSLAGKLPGSGEFEFEISMRTRGLTNAQIGVGVFDAKGKFKGLGSYWHEGGEDKWERATIRFRAPENGRRFRAFISCPDEVGGQLWLDDAQLTSVK